MESDKIIVNMLWLRNLVKLSLTDVCCGFPYSL
jgi:hypothetical protein